MKTLMENKISYNTKNKSNKNKIKILLLIFTAIAVQNTLAQDKAREPYSLNVKDFGAKGDGKTDDAAAIQAALNEQGRRTIAVPHMWTAAQPELIFPEGVYIITRTLIAGLGADPANGIGTDGKGKNIHLLQGSGFVQIRGVGEAVIFQTDPDADVIYLGYCVHTVIDSLHFKGGKNSINIWTGNQDQGMPVIRNCTFSGSRSFAVSLPEMLINEKGEYRGFFMPDANGKLQRVTEKDDKYYPFLSSYLLLDNCTFTNCYGALETGADMSYMENCRIILPDDMKGPAVKTHGMLKMENITGFANVKNGSEQRWVDLEMGNGIWIYGKNMRLQTSDSGMNVVRANVKYRISGNVNHTAVILEECSFNASGAPGNSAVYCTEIPNMISLRNCTNTGSTRIEPVFLGKNFDQQYMNNYRNFNNTATLEVNPEILFFTAKTGNVNISSNLPALLTPYGREVLPVYSAVKSTAVNYDAQQPVLNYAALFAAPPKTIYADQFGLAGDGITDDTEKVREVFAKAGKGPVEIVFPGKVFLVTGKIRLPDQALIRANGRAVFISTGARQFGFIAENPVTIGIKDIVIDMAEIGLNFSIQKGVKAKILLDRVQIMNSSKAAIFCMSADTGEKARLGSKIEIHKSLFVNNYLDAEHNIDMHLRTTWITGLKHVFQRFKDIKTRSWEDIKWGWYTDDSYTNRATCVINHGRLSMVGMLGVPGSDAYGRNLRWVDNYGTFISDYSRFGGERCGQPVVHIKKPLEGQSITVIQNSWPNHQNKFENRKDDPHAVKPTSFLVYSEIIPDLLSLRQVLGKERCVLRPPTQFLGPTIQFPPSLKTDALLSRVFMLGNIVPEEAGTREETLGGPVVVPVFPPPPTMVEALGVKPSGDHWQLLYENESPRTDIDFAVQEIYGAWSKEKGYLWRVDFTSPFDSTRALFIIYLDADNKPDTGRTGADAVRGTDMMLVYKNKKTELNYSNDEARAWVKRGLRCYQDGLQLFFVLDIDLPLDGKTALYRFRYLCQGTDGKTRGDSVDSFIDIEFERK